MPRLSIIIPVFNVGDYLAACLDSILSQGGDDLEIILVNDASSDRSGAICDAYARNNFVRVIHHDKNVGVSVARNDGIRQVCGDYILFVDSDDIILEGGLNALGQTIGCHKDDDVVVTRYTLQNGESSNDFLFHPDVMAQGTPAALLDHINRGLFHPDPCWHYAIKRSFLMENDLFFLDVKVAEDMEYVARLLTLAATIAFCPAPFYCYRERDGSLTKSRDVSSTSALLLVANALHAHKKNFAPDTVQTEFLYRCIVYALGRFAARLTTHDDAESASIAEIVPEQVFHDLAPLFGEADIKKLISEFGISASLVRYRDAIDQNTLGLLSAPRSLKTYLYCMGPTALAVMHTFQKHKVPIEGIIDDNKSLQGRFESGVPFLTSADFAALLPSILPQTQVIVCMPRIPTYRRVAEKLVGMGLPSERIAHRKI